MNKHNRIETSFMLDRTMYQKDRKKTNNNKEAINRTQSEKFLIEIKTPKNAKESPVLQKASGKNLKLRDYLFLVGINSKRSCVTNVGSPEKNKQEPSTPMTPSASSRFFKSTEFTRSIKYGIDNRHVQTVVANEIQQDLNTIACLTSSIKDRLGKLLRSDQIKQEDMIQVYAHRRALKEKILKELMGIDDFVKKKEGLEEQHQQLMGQVLRQESFSFIFERQPSRQFIEERQASETLKESHQRMVDQVIIQQTLNQSAINICGIEELIKKESEDDNRNQKIDKSTKRVSFK